VGDWIVIPRFLPSCVTAYEELEALQAVLPGAQFHPATADVLADERQREAGVIVVHVHDEGGDVHHRRRHRVVDTDALPLLLTPTMAARALAIDRRTTLAGLIADDAIDTVRGPGGRVRMPRSEVLRLAEEGIPPPGNRRRPRKRNRRRPLLSADATASAIMGIKID